MIILYLCLVRCWLLQIKLDMVLNSALNMWSQFLNSSQAVGMRFLWSSQTLMLPQSTSKINYAKQIISAVFMALSQQHSCVHRQRIIWLCIFRHSAISNGRFLRNMNGTWNYRSKFRGRNRDIKYKYFLAIFFNSNHLFLFSVT